MSVLLKQLHKKCWFRIALTTDRCLSTQPISGTRLGKNFDLKERFEEDYYCHKEDLLDIKRMKNEMLPEPSPITIDKIDKILETGDNFSTAVLGFIQSFFSDGKSPSVK